MQRNRGITKTEEQIGQLLVEGGFITQELLDEAITIVQQEAITLRKALVSKGHIADETYSTFLSVPLVDLRQVSVSAEAVRLVPEDVARNYNVLPLMVEGDSLRVAMDDPQDMDAINTLTMVTGFRIRPRLPTHGTVEGLLGQHPKWWTNSNPFSATARRGRCKHNRSRVLRPLRPRPPRLPDRCSPRKR